MTLTDAEFRAFLSTHLGLLYYVGQQSNIISDDISFHGFIQLEFPIKLKCRDILLDNRYLLEDYITTKRERLTSEQIVILKGFKRAISSDFVIFKYLKNHAIFIDTKNNRFYAVKALGDRFDRFFTRLPVLLETTLLPFNDKIIYDGFIKSSRVHFGPGMRSTMLEDYKQVKLSNQILTTL